MIGATTTTSSGFNPLSIFSILQYPFIWVLDELVKVFTSTESLHVSEVVTSSREGGASLNILSGLVAGNFSAYWLGISIVGGMMVSQVLTLYTTPVIYLYMDRLQLRFRGRKRAAAIPGGVPSTPASLQGPSLT